MDFVIRKDEPPTITETSLPGAVDLYEKWERSNHICVMFIKTNITASIRGTVEKHDKVCPLLNVIEDQFQTFDKALASILIMQFSSLQMTRVKGVHEHIMRMGDIATQLKTLEVDMSKSFLVHYILNTFPPEYAPLKISYNTHSDK
ncbi:hypothetical protein Syun_012481 [Stephania yunnanensis]|uniref:UBN2_2 domain-containing protein n=1 Tax=Stephania yunnanensis TaxID=152371 RepID=A0AAP0PJI4_9MAGN